MRYHAIKTFGQLKAAGYKTLSVKDEIRKNLIYKLKSKVPLFPGIVGYNDSVIPEIINALLSKHHFVLLGLRGQAKTKLLRQLSNFLDEYIPVIKGSPLNEDPFHPITKYGKGKIANEQDQTEIEWLPRELRYQEKLATPDVTMADLIGDVDPIKAVTKRLSFSDEDIIHFGIIPRTNRGIFAINELPDLQPRIQVGLFNILEENDLQIRGFPVRFPLDILLVFSANPEDYTNRGNIITPLKDRIDSQIITHYPRDMQESLEITLQEAWINRAGETNVVIPQFFYEIIEQITIEARSNKDYIDQRSGVSVRMTISSIENFISNIERRAIANKESKSYPRISDLQYIIASMTGKMELVYEGEQEGIIQVASSIIGLAIKKIFSLYCPPAYEPAKKGVEMGSEEEQVYRSIITYFESGKKVHIQAQSSFEDYYEQLVRVPGLLDVAKKFLPLKKENKEEMAAAMEFILEGLHFNSRLSKIIREETTAYGDMITSMLEETKKDEHI